MKLLVPVFVFAVLATASAANARPQPIREAGLSEAVVGRIEQTALKLQLAPEDPRSYCTAFPVSPDGYLLTALHCVRHCLKEAGALDEASNEFFGLKDLFVVNRPWNTDVNCAKFSIPATGIEGVVKVVATGSALMIYESQLLADHTGLFRQLSDRGWDRKANDFALLKVEPRNPLACLPLNSKSLGVGQEIWAVGYPTPAEPAGSPVLNASRGRLFPRVEESLTYQSKETESERQWIRTQFGAPSLIFSNAWNEFGQSGGPIINASGEVVGVISGFASPVAGKNKGVHELAGAQATSILRSLPRDLARELMTKNSACALP